MSVIDRAMMAHAQIKERLKRCILFPEGIDGESIRSDRTCEFGLWIYGPQGLLHVGRPEYQALKKTHKHFHEAAYTAFCLCRSGKKELAAEVIETGEFEQMSAEMKVRLANLRKIIS